MSSLTAKRPSRPAQKSQPTMCWLWPNTGPTKRSPASITRAATNTLKRAAKAGLTAARCATTSSAASSLSCHRRSTTITKPADHYRRFQSSRCHPRTPAASGICREPKLRVCSLQRSDGIAFNGATSERVRRMNDGRAIAIGGISRTWHGSSSSNCAPDHGRTSRSACAMNQALMAVGSTRTACCCIDGPRASTRRINESHHRASATSSLLMCDDGASLISKSSVLRRTCQSSISGGGLSGELTKRSPAPVNALASATMSRRMYFGTPARPGSCKQALINGKRRARSVCRSKRLSASTGTITPTFRRMPRRCKPHAH